MDEDKVITNMWSLAEIDALIKAVKETPEIYDNSQPGYGNLAILERCWQSVAEYISHKNEQMCRSKWHILRASYRARKNDPTGKGKSMKKWAHCDALTFLDNHIGKRKSTPDPEEYYETIILDPKHNFENGTMLKLDDVSAEDSSTSKGSESAINPNKRSFSSSAIEDALTDYFRRKKPKSSVHFFLLSLEDDISKLSPKGLRNFKRDVMDTLEKYLEEEDKDRI